MTESNHNKKSESPFNNSESQINLPKMQDSYSVGSLSSLNASVDHSVCISRQFVEQGEKIKEESEILRKEIQKKKNFPTTPDVHVKNLLPSSMIVASKAGDILHGEGNIGPSDWNSVEGIVAMNDFLRKITEGDSEVLLEITSKGKTIYSYSENQDRVVLQCSEEKIQKQAFVESATFVSKLLSPTQKEGARSSKVEVG